MSNDSFQIAFERATSEITEIDAWIDRLTRRRELLAGVVEPLKRLAAAGGPAIFPDMKSEGGTDLIEDPESFSQPQEGANGDLESVNASADSPEDVAVLAYRFWNERGGIHGHHEEDWYRALEELQHSAL
jgi:Protein of unknown function (DUF2934)